MIPRDSRIYFISLMAVLERNAPAALAVSDSPRLRISLSTLMASWRALMSFGKSPPCKSKSSLNHFSIWVGSRGGTGISKGGRFSKTRGGKDGNLRFHSQYECVGILDPDVNVDVVAPRCRPLFFCVLSTDSCWKRASWSAISFFNLFSRQHLTLA